MKIQYITDVGRRRQTNQDSAGVFVNETGKSLTMVADGMGGHQAGDVASQMLISLLGESWQATQLTDADAISKWLSEMIQTANEAIYQAGVSDATKAGMGTTVVAAVLLENQVLFANVGDSRLYLIKAGEICQMTEDHSLVHELVKSGEISEEMAANHPRKNVLTRSVGTPEEVVVDIDTFEVEVDDILLLCSDGLTNMVSDNDILTTVVSKPTLEEVLHDLINSANEAGGADNITALLAKICVENEVHGNG